MLGSVDLALSIKGALNIGSEPSSMSATLRSLSTLNLMHLPLLAHLELTATDSFLFCNLPYTMGAAIASTAQAAKNRSPVLAAIACPVSSRDRG